MPILSGIKKCPKKKAYSKVNLLVKNNALK